MGDVRTGERRERSNVIAFSRIKLQRETRHCGMKRKGKIYE